MPFCLSIYLNLYVIENRTELYGLILCGGRSSRMGTDKSLLSYHGRPQRYHLYDLLQSFCDRVFISCSKEQVEGISPGFNSITDEEKYVGTGPMAALLTAFEKFPFSSFLVLGCDYPFIQKKNIQQLVDARTGSEQAVCYCNPVTKISEPLFTIYENDAYPQLLKNFSAKKYSLRHFLDESNVTMLSPDSFDFLQSVDTIESCNIAKEILSVERG